MSTSSLSLKTPIWVQVHPTGERDAFAFTKGKFVNLNGIGGNLDVEALAFGKGTPANLSDAIGYRDALEFLV